jgi:hypothetical protein
MTGYTLLEGKSFWLDMELSIQINHIKVTNEWFHGHKQASTSPSPNDILKQKETLLKHKDKHNLFSIWFPKSTEQ